MSHGPRPDGAGLDDAALVRYLDGELPEIERARLERDLAGDPAAAARLATLRRRSERLRTLLHRDDAAAAQLDRRVPEPPHRTGAAPRTIVFGRPRRDREALRLRAAVVILALLAAGLVVPPVRAWIASGITRLTGDEAAAGVDVHAAQPTPGDDTAVTVTLEARGDTFDIRIDRHQAEGTLIVRRSRGETAALPGGDTASDDRGRAVLRGAAGDADLLVLPGSLHVRNGEGARASYEVSLPASIRSVRIRIGDHVSIAPLTADPLEIVLRR
jgi:hypothetical protein